jgi:hypothetical protein
VGLPDEKPTAYSAWAATQLDELPTAGDGTLEIQDAVSKRWDAALGIRNADSETMGAGLASVHSS